MAIGSGFRIRNVCPRDGLTGTFLSVSLSAQLTDHFVELHQLVSSRLDLVPELLIRLPQATGLVVRGLEPPGQVAVLSLQRFSGAALDLQSRRSPAYVAALAGVRAALTSVAKHRSPRVWVNHGVNHCAEAEPPITQ